MQIPSDYMVLASAQSFLQKEAEIFAKDNEQPLQLVTACLHVEDASGKGYGADCPVYRRRGNRG
jgi:hypothetical protein